MKAKTFKPRSIPVREGDVFTQGPRHANRHAAPSAGVRALRRGGYRGGASDAGAGDGEGREAMSAAETLRVLRDRFAGDAAISASDAACLEAIEAIAGDRQENGASSSLVRKWRERAAVDRSCVKAPSGECLTDFQRGAMSGAADIYDTCANELERSGDGVEVAGARQAATSGWVCRPPVSVTPEQAKAIAADALAVSAEVKSAVARDEAHAAAAALLALATRWDDMAESLGRDARADDVCVGKAFGLRAAAADLRRLLGPPRGPGGGERAEPNGQPRAAATSEEANVGDGEKGIRRKTDTSEPRAHWEHVDRCAAEAKSCPAWKRGGVSSERDALDSVLSEASRQVAAWPDYMHSDDVKRRRAAFDARVATMGAQKVSDGAPIKCGSDAIVSSTFNGVTISAPATMTLGDVWRALSSRPEIRVCLNGERRHAADEARADIASANKERDEARAEVERLRGRMQVLDSSRTATRTALGAVDGEGSEQAAKRVAQERDTAYQRGQEEMLSRIRRIVTQKLDAYEASGGVFAAAPLRDLGAELSRIAVAKTPTVSASEVTGEAIPGAEATETAGAGESVARDRLPANDLAARWKASAGASREQSSNHDEPQWRGYHDGRADAYATCADELRAWRSDEAAEIARLRADIERQRGIVEGYAAKVESYAAEIASAGDRLAKARYERGRSDDALKAIEDVLLSAGVTPQSDESLADTVRRALEGRGLVAPKMECVDHAPLVGDRVVFLFSGGGEEPGLIRRVREDGKYDLWTTSAGQPFVYGVDRSRFRLWD